MVHLDLYDTKLEDFVDNGEWVMVLTTLIFEGEKTGTLLLNYDTEDINMASLDKCPVEESILEY